MLLREEFEKREHDIYRKCASFSDESKGRDVFEEKCDIRTDYQRDRDRIIHSKSFRRLKHKTQVFLSPDDHYRTRLTHTLEVAQIARTIARALRLNEDLTEAIALGHDLGHTPFGHAGERALTKYAKDYIKRPFLHNEQRLRVVEKLEKNGRGLNLTWEVRDGIVNHKTSCNPATLEGHIVRISDKIAYVNHDIDDGIRAGLLSEESLPKECTDMLGHSTRDRINSLIHATVIYSMDKELIAMPEDFQQAFTELRAFMFKDLYTNPIAKGEETKAETLIGMLFNYYMENVERLPDEYRDYINQGEDKAVVVCDYIAGMTDNYAVNMAKKIFIPKSWQSID